VNSLRSTPLSHARATGRLLTALAVWLVAAAGCSSGPSRIEPPAIDADEAGAQAMEMYDKDGDGFIAGAELDASPELKAAMETIDADKDGKVTDEEIAQRVEAWQANRTGITAVRCSVTFDGRPVEGATVTFEPARFLGGEIQSAIGKTSLDGIATPIIPKEKRPRADTPPGIQLGLFKVRISKEVNGKETIPARYNSESVLGQQVAPDDPAMLRQRMEFALKSD